MIHLQNRDHLQTEFLNYKAGSDKFQPKLSLQEFTRWVTEQSYHGIVRDLGKN